MHNAGFEVMLHDLNGRLLGIVGTGRLSAGVHNLVWDCTAYRQEPISSGVLVVRIVSRGIARASEAVRLMR